VPAALPEQDVWEGHPSFLLIFGRVAGFVVSLIFWPLLGYAFMTYALPFAALQAPLRPWITTHESRVLTAVAAIVGVILLLNLVRLLLAIGRVKSTHYRLTSQRLLIESGLLSKSVDEIDLRYIDDLEFRQTLLDRLLGIGQVFVVSSDKLAPKLAIRGIKDPRGLREKIRAHAYQVSQRQFFTRST
jgi:hypothetical protein